MKYMRRVVKQKLYCPRYGSFKELPCPTPPRKEIILGELYAALKKKYPDQREYHKLGYKIGKYEANTHWLLVCLATVDSENRLFAKSYFPSPVELNKEAEEEELVSDDEEFFKDMPLISARSKKAFKGRNSIIKAAKKAPELKISVKNAKGKKL